MRNTASALITDLEEGLARRREAGLWRTRRTIDGAQRPRVTVDGRPMLAFASNDYLGLAADAALVDAACDGARRFGVGAGASHLVCGHHEAHAHVEAALADYVAPCQDARAVLATSGYLANLSVLTALAGRGDAIFADRLNHACLNDGALLSRADFVRYRHVDVASLAGRLAASTARRRIIATDAVFSMDGDLAPLPALLELAREHDAWLVVDDAHGFGVTGGGRGSLAEFALADERIVYMGTLGKAAGVAGAFVAAHPAVIDTIVQTARPYIYTTAAPALQALAIAAALRAIERGEDRRTKLASLIQRFREGATRLPWRLGASRTPIQPLIVGDNAAAVALSEGLADQALFVPAIRPPTVPNGTARLRISISAAHQEADIDCLLDALARLA